jgi:hypothetical protein
MSGYRRIITPCSHVPHTNDYYVEELIYETVGLPSKSFEKYRPKLTPKLLDLHYFRPQLSLAARVTCGAEKRPMDW